MSTRLTAGRPLARSLVVLAAAAALATATSTLPGAAWGSDPSRPDPRDSARGLVYSGLIRASTGPCAGGFEIRGPGLARSCTHGPDPAPPGVDVTAESYDAFASAGTAIDSVAVPCIGDGTSGPRIQAVYAVAADRTDRYATVAPQIVTWAGQMENAVEKSAEQSGGSRYLRFVTPSCSLSVAKVVLSPTGDDSFGNTISELRAAGLNRTDRKYVIWADALVYCGIGQMAGTDTAGSTNPANTGPSYGRVDTGCWNRTDHSSALHELFHTLGAVQPSAPHSTSLFHCTDESDALCYSDAAGVTTTQACPAENEWLLDCGNDDYFDAAPASGSYLATHWNTADSVFLASSLTAGDPVVTPAPPAPPAATASDSFSGNLTSKKPVAAFSVQVGAGATTSALTYAASGRAKTAPTLKVRILNTSGTVVASGTGPTVLRVAASLTAGTYRWEVSGSTSASFTLAVTHVAY